MDPAFGTGAFYSALLREFSPSHIIGSIGFEIDPSYGLEAIKLWKDTNLHLAMGNFTKIEPPDEDEVKPNLIICNPPYVRHHHLSIEEKQRFQAIIKQTLNIKLSGLSGLYCYFLLLAHRWLADGGFAGWLIPTEFMDVNYGHEIKKYLLDHVTLMRVHIYDSKEVLFDDALVSSAVVWFRKIRPSANHVVEFTYGTSLRKPSLTKSVPVQTLQRTRKWTSLVLRPELSVEHEHQICLSDLFDIKRGLATGSNSFFILSSKLIGQYEIPERFLRPILPSPRYLSKTIIETDEHGNPLLEPRLYLLDCKLPEEIVERDFPRLWEYFQIGIERGIHEGYLCQHRTPWYTQENRKPPLFLCTYMGRWGKDGGGKPLRFILNRSQATAPNVYLLLYPKPFWKDMLYGSSDLITLVWDGLNDLDFDSLLREGRVYGGELHKIEPKELGRVPANEIAALLPGFAKAHQLELIEAP
jgi:hypothetical protein